MGFECPYFQEEVCVLQKGKCVPAIGNCILKGKVSRAKDEGKGKDNKKD